jgi:actin-like ATPase involved in cell morphogenesis
MKAMDSDSALRQAFHALRDSADQGRIRGSLVSAVRRLPKTAEYIDLFTLGFELAEGIPDPAERRRVVLDYVREIPPAGVFHPLYLRGMEAAVIAADSLDEPYERTTELVRLAGELPKTGEFLSTRRLAWRLALDLPDRPRFAPPSIEKVARELPKASDVLFYRRFTLLGVAKAAPKDGPFVETYREAMEVAIKASSAIDEPYYRKYALISIANETPRTPEYADLHMRAMAEAHRAAMEIKDPFAREHALMEMLRDLPRTREYFPMLQEALTQALSFFTVRRWMDDIDAYDVVDYILSAEELGIKESKKKRYSRENYAKVLSKELERLASGLNDTRFIETLRPYTRVWVRPGSLRDSVKKVVARLETLRETYHGAEIERPVLLKACHPECAGVFVHRKGAAPEDCISIDLGASNTVVMRRRGDAQPEFVELPLISRRCGGVSVVPTVLGAETNTIGASVVEDEPIINMKQMLIEGNPRGRAQMERFFKILYQHLRKNTVGGGWFSLSPKNPSDVLFMTVPVGYRDYRDAMREIVARGARGVAVEFIEEPLAAAIGYHVAGPEDRVVMLIDFGGSTLNTMVVRLNVDEVHVVAKPDRAQVLGGHDIDRWLAEHIALKAGLAPGVIPHRLVSLAESIKIELSGKREVPFHWGDDVIGSVTREEFEEVLERRDFYRYVDRTISNVLKRAEKVGLRKEMIEAVLLTGGSSQIPSFKDKVGDIFPGLRSRNLIYDHSPLSAVGSGAALYGTKDVSDSHLGMAYALRCATGDDGRPFSYGIVLEKAEPIPLEKVFAIAPACRLGVQTEIHLEIYEVPDRLIARRWVSEAGVEFIKQEIVETGDLTPNAFKTVTLPFAAPVEGPVEVSLLVDEHGALGVRYGPENRVLETGIRLQ